METPKGTVKMTYKDMMMLSYKTGVLVNPVITPDDWERVINEVIIPDLDNIVSFIVEHGYFLGVENHRVDIRTVKEVLAWFLSMSIEDRMELVLTYGKEELGWRYD